MKYFLSILFLILVFNAYSQSGDCPPTPVCANTTGTTMAGSISELSAATDGCLVGEATRTSWLSVCITSNGLVRFAITPGGGVNNDMDFAVWGPNSPCPPTSAPIRCSYAAVPLGGPKVTGINSVNNAPQTDVSEGGGGNQWVQDLNVLAGECYIICISNYAGGNNNWSLNFTGTTAGLLCSALPIELISFTGKNNGSYNLLEWTTASEVNNNFFTLERSTNGNDWTEIAKIDGTGNSSIHVNYQFKDYSYLFGSYNYYRLSQTDFDGTKETFDVIYILNEFKQSKIKYSINILGQEVQYPFSGLVIHYYEDGSYRKVFYSTQE